MSSHRGVGTSLGRTVACQFADASDSVFASFRLRQLISCRSVCDIAVLNQLDLGVCSDILEGNGDVLEPVPGRAVGTKQEVACFTLHPTGFAAPTLVLRHHPQGTFRKPIPIRPLPGMPTRGSQGAPGVRETSHPRARSSRVWMSCSTVWGCSCSPTFIVMNHLPKRNYISSRFFWDARQPPGRHLRPETRNQILNRRGIRKSEKK